MKGKSILGSNMTKGVKEVLGTCVSMGVTIDDQDPRDVQRLIDQGDYKVGD